MEDLARLVELYSSLPDEVLKTGLFTFGQTPPEDTSYLVHAAMGPISSTVEGRPSAMVTFGRPEGDRKLLRA